MGYHSRFLKQFMPYRERIFRKRGILLPRKHSALPRALRFFDISLQKCSRTAFTYPYLENLVPIPYINDFAIATGIAAYGHQYNVM
jgi:hypothetical protein